MVIKPFITPQGLQQLKNYAYKSGKYTIMDNFFNPYWQWVVKKVPTTVAPNVLTFIGWILTLLSYIVMLPYDYTLEEKLPSWCFFFAAACIWAYSTLDAIDGKQARRTKSSSPLGQLFDHGCDSFSISFFMLAVSQATQLKTQEIFILFLAAQSSFWTANWLQYNTGVLLTNVGQFGVTQGEMTCMILHLITGFCGQQFWQIKLLDIIPASLTAGASNSFVVWTLNLELGGFVAYYFGTLLFLQCFYIFVKTIFTSPNHWKPIRECFTFYVIISFQVLAYNMSFFDKNKGLILMNFGLLTSLVVCKVIISSVTKMRLQAIHYEIVPMIIATIAMLIFDQAGDIQSQYTVYWISLAVNVSLIVVFLYQVINQITNFLGINCFSLQKRVKEE